MPFFLIARDEDDQLRLLTSAVSPSRQDALTLLSELTADPGFDAWDAEVLLVDVDAALPVLLVRPSEAASVPSSSPLAVEVEELEAASAPAGGVTFMWPAPEHIGEAREEDAVASPMSEIPAEEAEAFASYVSLADDQAPTEVDAETIPVDLDDLAADDTARARIGHGARGRARAGCDGA